MTISIPRQGEIGMHIMQSTQIPKEKWVRYFQSVDEVEFALKDENMTIRRMNGNQALHVRNMLTELKENFLQVQEAQEREDFPHLQQNSGGANIQTLPHVILPPQTLHASVQTTQTVIDTDKGCFFNFKAWASEIGAIYKHLEDFETILAMACLEVQVDPTIQYISEAKKKALTGKLKKCASEYLDSLADKAGEK